MKKILWPTDLSKHSLKAAKDVLSLAGKYQAQIILLYVGTDLASHFGGYAHEPGEHHLQHFREWELQQARKKMEIICDTELKACPNLEIKLVKGDAATEILKMIQAEKVIRNSPVTVHLVNPYRD